MEYLVTREEMQQIERYTMEQIKIPSIILMEQAANSVLEEIEKEEGVCANIFILCGVGNNGADGLALARILHQKDFKNITIGIVGKEENGTKEWKLQFEIIKKLGIPYLIEETWIYTIDFHQYNCIVDGLFGIGLSREVKGSFYDVINNINKAKKKVYAIDVPSGVCTNTGKVLGIAIKAYKTITFGYEKLGCMLYPGTEYSGIIVVKKIGFPKGIHNIVHMSYYTYSLSTNIETLMPKRFNYSNKGTFGKVAVFAGGKNMAGAAYMAGRAAYEIGAGLVKIVTCKANREIIQTLLPEALLTTYEPEKILWQQVKEAIDWASVIIVGPGLGVEDYVKQLLQFIINNSKVPIVLDADGINVLAKDKSMIENKQCQIVYTPHLKEFSRLNGETIADIQNDLLGHVHKFLQDNKFLQHKSDVLVCKDARTIVSSNNNLYYINQSGNHGMSTGGSGDVLSGIIGGLIAQGLEPLQGAVCGVFIHGLAGNSACKEKGAYSMKATDILEHISQVTKLSSK